MRLTEAIHRAIELAEGIDAYWSAELPKRHPNYPILRDGEDSGPPPPEDHELRQLFLALPPADLFTLIAVMHLGRGDFGASRVSEEGKRLAKSFPTADAAVDYMMAKGSLGDYLSDGLGALTAAGMTPDELQPRPAQRA